MNLSFHVDLCSFLHFLLFFFFSKLLAELLLLCFLELFLPPSPSVVVPTPKTEKMLPKKPVDCAPWALPEPLCFFELLLLFFLLDEWWPPLPSSPLL